MSANNVVSFPNGGAGVPLADRTDEELMVLVSAGLTQAMAVLIDRHQDRVRSFCVKWNASRGEDLAQDVFLGVWRTRTSYRPTAPFRVFLFTIARNRCRNAARDLFRRREDPIDDPPRETVDVADANQLDTLIEAERRRHVMRAVERLSEKLREVMLLRFGEGLSYGEIAEVVGAPEATVRFRVFLALKHLRRQLGEEDKK